ncbi:histidinol-phosphate transaminase [Flavobacterium enshiense]|uniref:histidinol-phosphate transaminase n=1 Tax=Flavobacterium enshiense TaxID=1341165 RepID=UPI00345D198A
MEINKLIRKNIAKMKPYSSARDEFKANGKTMLFLDANESPFENGVNRYPDPQQKAVKRVVSQLKNISENQILLGNGSDEVLDLLFRAFCEPNQDNIITLPPTYGMYSVLANLNAVDNREVFLSEEFTPITDSILEAIDNKTKIIFLCSPNNPTGNSFPEESVVKILENFKGIVVLDEAYIDFSDKESWLNKINDYPNLVIVQTFSKAYGMAGIRMGILYASKMIIAILNKIKPPYNLNILSQEKVLSILSLSESIKSKTGCLISEKDMLFKQLLQIKFVQKTYPSDANFILVKVDNANLRYQQLLEKGVVIRNRTNEPLCENCLRITIGTSQENIKLIDALKSLQ